MNTETKNRKERSFLIVSADGFARDIQIYTKALPDNEDDNFHDDEAGWRDFSGAVVIGVYTADSKENAILKASEHLRIHSDNLEAYEIINE